jgi:hypothetical protein
MENQRLRSQILELEVIIANLTKKIKDLTALLGQNSSNSNWPSGKDKFKAKPKDPSPDDVSDRQQGGQPGRPLFSREPIKPEDADDIQEYGLTPKKQICPHCGGGLQRDFSLDKKFDFLELPPVELKKIIRIIHGYRCQECGESHFNAPPKVVNAGLISTTLLALMSCLNTNDYMSIRRLQFFLEGFVDEKFSLGFISNSLIDTAKALWPIFLEMLDNVKYQPVLNVDETTWRLSDKLKYAWAFIYPSLWVFKVSSRVASTLDSILGPEFLGIMGCDCYSNYQSFP